MRSLTEALDEVSREIQVRIRCFPRWVQDGRMTATDSKDRLERLEAAHQFLKDFEARSVSAEDVPEANESDDMIRRAEKALAAKRAKDAKPAAV